MPHYDRQRARRGDLIILRSERRMSQREFDELNAQLQHECARLRGIQFLILDGGLTAQVVRRQHIIRRAGYTPRWARV